MNQTSTTTRWITTPLLIVAVLSQSCAAMSVGVCGCGDLSGQSSQCCCCCDQQARESGNCCCSSRSESLSVELSCCQQSQENCSEEQAVEKIAECHCGCSDQLPAPVAPSPVPQSNFNWDALLCACFAAHVEETDLTPSKRMVITESNLLSEPASSLQVLFCVWLT